MADEQRIGMPSGSDPGGRRPQVAAGFKVDSSSLKQLHDTWQLLIKDVKEFNKQLNAIPTKNLDRVAAALGRSTSGAGRSGGSGNSYITTPASPGSSQSPSVQESRGSGSRMTWNMALSTTAKTLPLAGLAAAGSYMQSHLQNIANIDTLFTQTLGASAGSYIGAPGKNSLYNFVFGTPGHPGGGIGGFQSAQDFGQGYQGLQGTFGPGFANTAAGRGMLAQVGAMGNLPGNNFTNASDLASQLYSPEMFWSLQRLGIMTTRPGGGKVDQRTIISQIISRVMGSNANNAQSISNSLGMGHPLNYTLSNLGFSQNAIQQIGQYAMANAQSGGRMNLNGGVVGNTAGNRAAGLTSGQSIQQSMNATYRSQTNLEQQVGNQSRGEIEAYFQGFGKAVDKFTQAVNALAPGGLGSLGGVGMAMSPIGKLMNGPIGNLLQFMMFEKVLGGLRGGGGAAAAMGEGGTAALASRTGMAALLSGGAGASSVLGLGSRLIGGLGITGLGITAANAGQSIINAHTKPGSTARSLGNIVGDMGRGAAIGAGIGAIGLPIPVLGEVTTAGGAVIGAAAGGLYGLGRKLFGDSGGNSNPWAQTGSTIDQIMALGKPTGAVVTSAYRPGGGSYHAAHEAVDFGWPGNDPNHLLAIDHFWASKYGTELAELIYTGPGGITIKNGKVIPPDQWNSFWGSAVVEEHKNHVHVAATPQSLRLGGGGLSVGGGGGSSSSSSSSQQSGSTASFSGSNPFSTNFGSVDVTTAYAGLMGGGVGMAGRSGSPSSGGSGTTGNTNKGSSTSANTPGPNLKGTPAQIGQQMAAQRGWTGAEWDALYKLWMRESSWNPKATNPSSGAYGIPQSLPADKMASAGADWRTNPATQMKWGMDYITGRYHDPIGAWQHETQFGWYRTGSFRTKEGPAYLHDDEMVLQASVANPFRQYVAKRKQYDAASPNLNKAQVVSGKAGSPASVTINAPIHFAQGASPADAKAFLQHVKQSMAEDEMFASLGMGEG